MPQKAETKVMKSELKKEKQVKGMLEYFGQKDKKKEVDKLAYPPPEKEIPLKVPSTVFVTQSQMIQKMTFWPNGVNRPARW